MPLIDTMPSLRAEIRLLLRVRHRRIRCLALRFAPIRLDLMDGRRAEESSFNFSFAPSTNGTQDNMMGPLIEIRNLLIAVCIMAVAMAICTVATMQTCYCYKLLRRKRSYSISKGNLCKNEKRIPDMSNAQERAIPTSKILARIDEFDLLTPLTPTVVPTNVFTLTGSVVEGPQYCQSPGRITLFPLGCSLRKVNSNRIYCSPDEPDCVYSIYNTGLPFTGAKSPHEELDLISMDRTTSASVKEAHEALNGCRKPQAPMNGVLKLDQSSSIPTSSTQITCADDVISAKCFSSTFDQLAMSNGSAECYKQNGIIPSTSSSNYLSSPSESSTCDSASGLDTTDSLSDNVFGCDDESAAVTERSSEIRLFPESNVNSSQMLRKNNNHCQLSCAAMQSDAYSLKLTNLDKIIEETESETDNSRIASCGTGRGGAAHTDKGACNQV
uniref:Uncharacterized protein n=1 Tax=Trichuris muris TaxID=70415 RepID=A0A5S6QAF6_TRIMR